MSKHYTAAEIEETSINIGNNYKVATIILDEGDTAESMLSDKWNFGGPGEVQYIIHPTGWSIQPSATVYKHYL